MFPDLDFFVFDLNGNPVAYSASINNNYEVVNFVMPAAGVRAYIQLLYMSTSPSWPPQFFGIALYTYDVGPGTSDALEPFPILCIVPVVVLLSWRGHGGVLAGLADARVGRLGCRTQGRRRGGQVPGESGVGASLGAAASRNR